VSNSRWNAIFHCWSKPFDDCIQELHWVTIQLHHDYYSICHGLYCTTEILYVLMNIARTSTRSHSLSICLPLIHIVFPSLFWTLYHIPSCMSLKKSNVFYLALLRYLFWYFCLICCCYFVFILLHLCNLYVLICVGEYVCRRFLLYNPAILTKLIVY